MAGTALEGGGEGRGEHLGQAHPTAVLEGQHDTPRLEGVDESGEDREPVGQVDPDDLGDESTPAVVAQTDVGPPAPRARDG